MIIFSIKTSIKKICLVIFDYLLFLARVCDFFIISLNMSFGAILEFVFNNSISDGLVGLSLLFVVPVVLTHGLVILASVPHMLSVSGPK